MCSYYMRISDWSSYLFSSYCHLPAISGRVAEGGVLAAVALRRFLGEVHATGKQALMGGAAVVDDEYERRHGALGDDFAQGLRSHRIDRRRLRSEEAELEGRLVRVLHGQPAVVAVACVGVDAEAELADVEVVGFVLVADVQADDQAGDGDVVCQRAVVHGS